MTAEERRAAIVDRRTHEINMSGAIVIADADKAAEAVLSLLESGEAGVRVVQAVVGVVLRQKLGAETARDDALAELAVTENIAYQNAVELTKALERLSLLRAENQRLREALDGR